MYKSVLIWYIFLGKKRTFEFLFLAVRVGYQLPVDSQSAYAPLPGKKSDRQNFIFSAREVLSKLTRDSPKVVPLSDWPNPICYALQANHTTRFFNEAQNISSG